MEANSYKKMKDYFQELVEQSNFLNDFVGFFQREWANRTAAYTSELASPNLTLFKYKLGFDGPEENTIAVRQIGFAIMFTKVAKDDFEAQYNAIDLAEQLAIKVMSRIKHDNNNEEHFLYNSLIKDSIEISPVELSASDFGVEVFFNLRNKQLLRVNPTDWKDIEKVC